MNPPSERRDRVERIFNAVAKGYDRPELSWFDLTASAIAQKGELGANQRALDIATGTGKVALALASTAPGAQVVGLDLSSAMLQVAQDKEKSAGLSNVSFEHMAFEEMKYGPSFDLVTCSFALFFVDEMTPMLQLFAAQVRPHGRLILSSFAPGSFSPFTDCFFRLFEEFGFQSPPPSWLRLSTEAKIDELFCEAQLPTPTYFHHDFGLEIPDAQFWWQIVWNAGYRGLLQMMDESQQREFKEQHLAEVQDILNQGETHLPVGVILATCNL